MINPLHTWPALVDSKAKLTIMIKLLYSGICKIKDTVETEWVPSVVKVQDRIAYELFFSDCHALVSFASMHPVWKSFLHLSLLYE